MHLGPSRHSLAPNAHRVAWQISFSNLPAPLSLSVCSPRGDSHLCCHQPPPPNPLRPVTPSRHQLPHPLHRTTTLLPLSRLGEQNDTAIELLRSRCSHCQSKQDFSTISGLHSTASAAGHALWSQTPHCLCAKGLTRIPSLERRCTQLRDLTAPADASLHSRYGAASSRAILQKQTLLLPPPPSTMTIRALRRPIHVAPGLTRHIRDIKTACCRRPRCYARDPSQKNMYLMHSRRFARYRLRSRPRIAELCHLQDGMFQEVFERIEETARGPALLALDSDDERNFVEGDYLGIETADVKLGSFSDGRWADKDCSKSLSGLSSVPRAWREIAARLSLSGAGPLSPSPFQTPGLSLTSPTSRAK